MKNSISNTPIEILLKEYSDENCDFNDIQFVTSCALRYSETMPDSLARCLLYVLARYSLERPLDQ